MLIIRRLKADQLHLITPLEDAALVEEEALLKIGRLGIQLGYMPLPRPEWRRFPAVEYADPAFITRDEDSAFYAAFEDEKYIGCACVTVTPTGWAEILDMRIDAAHRRQGAGRMLLEKCAAFSQKRALYGLRAACTDLNPVMCHFLENNDFTLNGFDQMVMSQSPMERSKPKSKRASLLLFYRLNQKG